MPIEVADTIAGLQALRDQMDGVMQDITASALHLVQALA